jgi:hypothetical protein
MGCIFQSGKEAVKLQEGFQRNQRRTKRKLKRLGTQHPTWNKNNSAVRRFAINTFLLMVIASPTHWQ